ncbi:MAG: hypothetical protein HKO59_01675 [Phycisphaerales bacterium]|nr:hypothetical protein [Phycisphaerales bacterium]NNM24691.1 hypothetical protein [Phycisphaerales bacterium]
MTRPCPACGYDLQGLPPGRLCPECGGGAPTPGAAVATGPRGDFVAWAQPHERRAWEIGLLLAAGCLVVAMVARLAYFLLAAPGPTPDLVTGYVSVGAVTSVVWVLAVWLVTPSSLDRKWAWMPGVRWLARLLAFGWLVGYMSLTARFVLPAGTLAGPGTPGVPDWWMFADFAGRFFGGLSAMSVAFILHMIALDADLPRAAWRANAVVWLLWFPTLLAQAFPDRVAWFTLIPLALVLLAWSWLLVLFALAAYELHRHVKWWSRHQDASIGRVERVQAKRRAMEAEVARQVRPVPTSAADVALDTPEPGAPK